MKRTSFILREVVYLFLLALQLLNKYNAILLRGHFGIGDILR